MKRTTEIIELLDEYESVVARAKEMNLISTKNFVGDIIETLVCDELGAKKCKASQKGYDAVKDLGQKKERIQIKFRSLNNKGKYKITFKNVTQNDIGFDTLAFCCQNNDGYKIYEIRVEDFPNTQFKKDKNRRILFLEDTFLNSKKTKKHEIKRC